MKRGLIIIAILTTNYLSEVSLQQTSFINIVRQGTLREYLPPSNTQKPRPFERPPEFEDDNNIFGYPPRQNITPRPPFSIVTSPVTGEITGGSYPSPPPEVIPPYHNTYAPSNETPQPPFPTINPAEYPTIRMKIGEFTTSKQPYSTYPFPAPQDVHPSAGLPSTDITTISTEVPATSPFSTAPTFHILQTFPAAEVERSTTYHPSSEQPPIENTSESHQYTSSKPSSNPPEIYYSSSILPEMQTFVPRAYPEPNPTDKYETNPSEKPTEEVKTSPPYPSIPDVIEDRFSEPTIQPSAEDLKHPPHIHAIDVECAKDMMTINIEFNRQFDGVIYSKGYYNKPECRYVTPNSARSKYTFTVNLNSCGTEFVNAFDTQGQSYLENILVVQNELGIQEVWDTVRSVRCLWEGNLSKILNVSLNVGMLTQEIVTFSGDTAVARLDIQVGRGPFASTATGLVKIGEQMTLVVSVTGDRGFDVQVKECQAVDDSGENKVALTDSNGCILKPKLFGAFQKTRETGNTGASIIAYAYFNAFKFPDITELIIECNVDLCKTDCDVCPDPNQKVDPDRRKRRNVETYNNSLGESNTIRKVLKVLLPQDLNNGNAIIDSKNSEEICVSAPVFVVSSVLLVSLLVATCLFNAYIWLKRKSNDIK